MQDQVLSDAAEYLFCNIHHPTSAAQKTTDDANRGYSMRYILSQVNRHRISEMNPRWKRGKRLHPDQLSIRHSHSFVKVNYRYHDRHG